VNALVWRLHRSQVWISGAALAALAALLAITGVVMADGYHDFLRRCAAEKHLSSAPATAAAIERYCSGLPQPFAGDGGLTDLVYATMAVPLLLGLFWGAPLLAGEFESGTHNLAWTQGVSRRRWLSWTVGWALVAAAAWGTALAVLVSWWRGPEDVLGIGGGTLGASVFDIQGIVPVAYSVFAVALGIVAGAVFRLVLPAMAATLAAFVGLRLLVAVFVRPHYLPPVSTLFPANANASAPPGSVVLSTIMIAPDGQHISAQGAGAACGVGSPSCQSPSVLRTLISYQPPSRFWEFQAIEAGIFLILAAVLVALAYRMVLARDA
jgi:hypothetical protein